jgi:hypothetical protein
MPAPPAPPAAVVVADELAPALPAVLAPPLPPPELVDDPVDGPALELPPPLEHAAIVTNARKVHRRAVCRMALLQGWRSQ